MSKRVCFILASLVLSVAPLAANWPQWRGPDLNGTSGETGLPIKWSKVENITWKLSGLAPRRSCGAITSS